jgi:hypothetical protein
MDMRVINQVTRPGMQDAHQTDLPADITFITGQLLGKEIGIYKISGNIGYPSGHS